MSRYIIIDLEKCPSKGIRDHILEDMLSKSWVLSEEETLAKFKEIYQRGVNLGEWIFDEYGKRTDKPKEFDELMKDL